jgi:cephalosporin hydroxylase
MKPTYLCDLATKYGTDKGPSGWNYTPFYWDLLKPEQHLIHTVLEVGIYKGASLRMWRDFFYDADIYGVDNSTEHMFPHDDDRIRCYLADAYDFATMQDIMRQVGPVDLFIDDAIHTYATQVALLKMMWPHIAAGGIYCIEETYTYDDRVPRTIPAPDGMSRMFTVRCHTTAKRWDIDSGKYALTVIRKAS